MALQKKQGITSQINNKNMGNRVLALENPIVTTGKQLDYANNLRESGTKIVQIYPFTENFFQDGIKKVTAFLKKEIDRLELH